MICHIVQNGGCMFLILCLCIFVVNSRIQAHTFTIQEFCSGNLYIHNIESGEPYVLTLKSEPAATGISKWYQKSKRKCQQEFKTSDSAAHFEVSMTNMSIPSCSNCRCSYFEISVLGHRKRYCGERAEESFSSKSDKLSINFHHGLTERFDVTFTFTVRRNFYIITGTPKDTSVSSRYIETPYFPTSYPPNYRVEYILQSDDKDSHVSLLFLDFQISHQSFIEITGNNGTHSTRLYGSVFRPPVIVSQSNRLALKFESNDQSGMPGFRALSSFIKSVDSLVVPYTDCGGPRDGRGGYINIKTHEGFGLYDCVWHIMPSFTLFSKSYLSVLIQLRNISHKSSLEFRNGRNSKSDIVREINCNTENCTKLDVEIVVPASDDLYIRFNGYLDVYSVFNMSYSTYHTGNCSKKEFICDGRCLLLDFRCDGIKQCPDGTDEELCPSAKIQDDHVPLHPNVQTEGFDSDRVYSTFHIIVLLGGFGLVAVVISVFIFMRNCCKSDPMITEQFLPQEASGEMSDVQPTSYPVNAYNCDNPPSYTAFLKSSDCYPPLLYTRANQHFVPKDSCMQCTTSFCAGARVRHHSVDSFNVRSSDSGSDIFLNITGDNSQPTQPLNSNRYNVEINDLAFKVSRKPVKRSCSLDSKLNDLVNKDSCNLYLSIIHPVCSHTLNHLSHVQCSTLPPNLKMSAFKRCNNNVPNIKKPSWLQLDSTINLSKDRRFTWSFVPHRSVGSEIVTIVKTRCFSDPCHGISVHCSLY